MKVMTWVSTSTYEGNKIILEGLNWNSFVMEKYKLLGLVKLR
jgi:hypothetical protein